VPQDGIVSPAYTNIEKNNEFVDMKYYYYWFLSLDMQKTFLHLSKNLRSSIGTEEFASLPSVFPPYKEQALITEFLNEKSQKIDSLINKLQTQITKIQEYRQALITEAVTGKIDVRGM
jgi:restriction endonuclease S subunit